MFLSYLGATSFQGPKAPYQPDKLVDNPIVADEIFWDLDGPVIRITTPHIPLPAADALEDATMPSAERIVREIVEKLD